MSHISLEQRAKLSAAQLAYFANDPRWPAHRAKLAAAQVAKRRVLTPAEIEACVGLRARSASFSVIGDMLGIGRDTLCRELRASGFLMTPVQRKGRTALVVTPARPSPRRMTLLDAEVAQVRTMRSKGRNFAFIAEELRIDKGVLSRELRAIGFPTAPIRAEKRARRGAGFWRSFD